MYSKPKELEALEAAAAASRRTSHAAHMARRALRSTTAIWFSTGMGEVGLSDVRKHRAALDAAEQDDAMAYADFEAKLKAWQDANTPTVTT